MESCGFSPASECIVLALGSKPQAALFEGADKIILKVELQVRHDTALQDSRLAAAASTDDAHAWQAEIVRQFAQGVDRHACILLAL